MKKAHFVTLPGYQAKWFFDSCTDLGLNAVLIEKTLKINCTDDELQMAWDLWKEKVDLTFS
jgi:hypothetical protein